MEISQPLVVEIQIEPDYWSRGHFHQGTRKRIVVLCDVQSLPVGAKFVLTPLGDTSPSRPTERTTC